MKSVISTLPKLAGLVTLFTATPALADDWKLACSFPTGQFAALVDYDAGGPTYSLTVTQSGETEIGRGQQIALRPIKTPDEIVLLGTGLADMSLVMRINPETMGARVEIGNGVSWDYKNLQSRCSVIQQ